MTNRELVEYLFTTGRIDLTRAPLFDAPPPGLPPTLDPDKVEGMLLGIAIGDALGMTTEGPGWTVDRRRRLFPGGIRDYFDGFGRPDPLQGRGTPSDDTQMSFWTLEQMLRDGGFIAENVARLFVEREAEIVGRGGTVAEFARRGKENKTPWYDWAPSAGEGFAGAGLGNGAVMRIAPIVLPHLKTRTTELWIDTALSARLTHNTSVSLASCLATVSVLWQCLGLSSPPDSQWWLEQFASVTEPLECQAYPPRRAMGIGAGSRTLTEVLRTFLPKAMAKGLSVRDTCSAQGWGSSSFVLETMPSLVYVLMRHGHNFEEGVLRAVNDTHDNDTIGAITGAILGALHGRKAIPQRWIENLTGRTRRDDDGQVFRLVQAARIFLPLAA